MRKHHPAGNNPEREESAGKPTNGKAQLPNGKPMNREDIIRMARESGMPYFYGTWEIANLDALERFAALVAAYEREECLKLVDEQIHNMTVLDSYPEQSGAIYQAIINIRARGEK